LTTKEIGFFQLIFGIIIMILEAVAWTAATQFLKATYLTSNSKLNWTTVIPMCLIIKIDSSILFQLLVCHAFGQIPVL